MPGKSEVIKVVIAGGLVFVGTARCNARDVGLPGRSAGDGWGRLRMAGDGWGREGTGGGAEGDGKARDGTYLSDGGLRRVDRFRTVLFPV